MGDNRYANQRSDSLRIERTLVLTDADVIRITEPMVQQFLSDVYDQRVTNELTDINEYSVENIESIKSKQKFNQIIGWSQLIKGISGVKTLLFKQRDDNQRMEAMQVFTDTIFPVLTLKESQPFGYNDVIEEEIDQRFYIDGEEWYNTCIQLVLMDPKKKDNRIGVRADVTYKSLEGSLVAMTLIGYKADLRLFSSRPLANSLVSQAIIKQILDKRDPNCPYVGLYAGPHLPPQKYRQCWPIFKPNSKPQNVTREQRSPFRHSGPKKQFVRRVGYLVSKQSLLCVCERYQGQSLDIHTQEIFTDKPDEHYFTSLLKDNMFCICDGRHTYVNRKHKKYEEMSFIPFQIPFQPKVVVLPEGLNSIVIHDVNTTIVGKQPYDYTVSQLSGRQLYVQQSMCLDWCQIQSDFHHYDPTIGQYFHPINYINDYYITQETGNTGLKERLCFSLYKCSKIQKTYTDQYHLYSELPAKAGVAYRGRGYFHYFKSISFFWQIIPKPAGSLDLNRYYKYDRYMQHSIKQYLPTHERTFKDQLNWILYYRKIPEIAHTLANLSIHQTENLSPVSMTKKLLIDDYNIVFEVPVIP